MPAKATPVSTLDRLAAQEAAEAYVAFANKESLTLVCPCKKHSMAWEKIASTEFISLAYKFGISPATNAGMGKLNHAILEAM